MFFLLLILLLSISISCDYKYNYCYSQIIHTYIYIIHMSAYIVMMIYIYIHITPLDVTLGPKRLGSCRKQTQTSRWSVMKEMASVDPPRHVLLGGLEHGFYDFPYWKNNPYIGNVIIPIDELIFVRGVGTPTSVEMQIGLKKQIQHAKHSGITYLLSLQRCQKHCKYVVSQRWWVCKFSTTYTNIVPNGAKRIGEVYVQYSWPLHLTLVVLACQASERAEWAERLVELQTEEKQTADVDAVELGAPMAPEKVFHFEPISIGDIEILRYWTTFWDILRYFFGSIHFELYRNSADCRC